MALELINADGKSVDGIIYSGDKKIGEYDTSKDRFYQTYYIAGRDYPDSGVRIGLAVKTSFFGPQYYDDFGGLETGSVPTNQWKTMPMNFLFPEYIPLRDAAVAYELDRHNTITFGPVLNTGRLLKADANADPPWKETSLPRGPHNIKIVAVQGNDISFQTIAKDGVVFYTQPETYCFRASAMKSGTSDILKTARECRQSGTAMHLTMAARDKVDNLAASLRRSVRRSAQPGNALGLLSQASQENGFKTARGR